ncbi:ESX-1 secretion-associated protein [Nocardia brasiliensis]|uniref:ESX-1 secretion-associated protein n=1 Tax=Nocardia brasiliensis TaxID=37326 RepID=A0A6G9XZM2_NOCBR|nr:type VII secretion target [Nocardia brasiliensis]QIS06371.1 ESX-1 secretion-associated protein [Nocardia brasiliensis]
MVERNQPPATNMQVDPAALRSFAQTLDTEASEVGGLNSGSAFTDAATALPGTEFGAAAQQADDVVHRCLQRIGGRLTTLAGTMHNAAGKYELAEDDFAAKLRSIGLS